MPSLILQRREKSRLADRKPRRHQILRLITGTGIGFARTQDIYIAVQTIGEIRQGVVSIRKRGDRQQAGFLEAWLDEVVERYGDQILDFDIECAQVWGTMMALDPNHPIDKQIAAIALMHDLIVVTRNTSDFEGTGSKLLDPFTLTSK